jgi:hypothetical protein
VSVSAPASNDVGVPVPDLPSPSSVSTAAVVPDQPQQPLPVAVAADQNSPRGAQESVDEESSESEFDPEDDIPLDHARGRRSGRSGRRKSKVAISQRAGVESDSGIEDDDYEAGQSVAVEAKEDEAESEFDFELGHVPGPGHTPPHHRTKSIGTPAVRLDDPTALDCFSLVFPYDIWVQMEQQTNIFGVWLAEEDTKRLKKTRIFKKTTVMELQVMHGLLMAMTLHKFTNINNYWKQGKLGAIKFPDFGRYMKKC